MQNKIILAQNPIKIELSLYKNKKKCFVVINSLSIKVLFNI